MKLIHTVTATQMQFIFLWTFFGSVSIRVEYSLGEKFRSLKLPAWTPKDAKYIPQK